MVYWAAHFHSHSVLHKLVEQGANVNTSVAADGDTPLMQADIEDTRFLLAHGAHPNALQITTIASGTVKRRYWQGRTAACRRSKDRRL